MRDVWARPRGGLRHAPGPREEPPASAPSSRNESGQVLARPPRLKWSQLAGYSALLAAALPARRPKLIAMEWLAPATTTG